MSKGLVKPKQYDWKDSNLALFGSDTEKQVKKSSAESEPAWKGVGNKVGLKIWRIVKFKVTSWPETEYGNFFSGDSYIILNTYKPDPKSEELAYDVHFWIGGQSTQDEYGTAAYKTVELDTYLDDRAVQHRETEGFESRLFKTYFPKLVVMEGGAESGFRHVQPEQYNPRLLHFSGERKTVTVREIPLCRSRVISSDVFILDLGLTLYQWNGSGANKDEKFKALQFLQQLKSERGGKCESETLEESGLASNHRFYESLSADDVTDFTQKEENLNDLYRVSDASGKLEFSKIKTSGVSKADLGNDDVFIFDNGKQCFVWVGQNASESERKNGMSYAHNHLAKTSHALVPIIVVKQGQHSADLDMALAA